MRSLNCPKQSVKSSGLIEHHVQNTTALLLRLLPVDDMHKLPNSKPEIQQPPTQQIRYKITITAALLYLFLRSPLAVLPRCTRTGHSTTAAPPVQARQQTSNPTDNRKHASN